MSPWQTTPFGSLLIDSKDGEWGEADAALGLREVLIVRGTDFQDLNHPDAAFPRRWVKDHIVERKRLRTGDLVLETAGGTSTQSTGRSAILNQSFFNRHSDLPVLCASFSRHLRLVTTKYSPRFIYYLLQALYRAGYMGVYNIQHTGVSRFQYTAFKNHTELQIPDQSVQRKIAAILSAYDELVEKNQERVGALEKVAAEVYREWFVRLRFPGHKSVPTVKRVPKGWMDGTFERLCQLQRGYDLTDADVDPGPYPVIASTSIKAYHSQFKVEPPVITTGRSGSLGHVLFVNERAWPHNTALYVKKFFGNAAFFVYYTLKNMKLENFNAGAGVPTLNRNHLNRLPMVIPSEDVQRRFHDVVAPMHSQVELLNKATEALVAIRDRLMPQLLSGKLDVERLDIEFPPGMAEEVVAEPIASAHA